MLGMMNSPNDGSLEFYSTNPKATPLMTEQDRKTFTEVKEKTVVSYTEDGRRLVNGKAEKVDPNSLWGNALLRGHVKVNILTDKDGNRKVGENKEETVERKDTVTVVEEPLLAHSHEVTTTQEDEEKK